MNEQRLYLGNDRWFFKAPQVHLTGLATKVQDIGWPLIWPEVTECSV